MVNQVKKPERGDIWWIAFANSNGTEIKKMRPAVVVSNDLSNKHLSRFQVVPITSNIDRLYPSESYIHIGKKKGKAMADQITTASEERLVRFESKLSNEELSELERAVKLQLGLI